MIRKPPSRPGHAAAPADPARRRALRLGGAAAATAAAPLALVWRPATAQTSPARAGSTGAAAPAGEAKAPPLPVGEAKAPPLPVGEAKAPPLPALGSRLELPELPLLGGGRFQPAAAAGQVLVLYWWASWCPFCAVQSPHVDALWRAHRGRGLQVLGLSIDKKPEDAAAYLARRGFVFPSGFVTPEVARVLPKPKGLPVTLVRGRDGRVVMAEAGQLFPEDVEQIARFL